MDTRRLVAYALLALSTTGLAACDAMESFGRGMEATGDRIEDKARQAEAEQEQNSDQSY